MTLKNFNTRMGSSCGSRVLFTYAACSRNRRDYEMKLKDLFLIDVLSLSPAALLSFTLHCFPRHTEKIVDEWRIVLKNYKMYRTVGGPVGSYWIGAVLPVT